MNDTREKIIETAFVLLVKNGYNGVSIGDITGALDITRSLPYRYFESKRELLFEACKQYYYERFFPKDFDVKSASMKELIEVVSENLERIIFGLSKSIGAEVSVFDYNVMYFDALRNEPRFKKFMKRKMLELRAVTENAVRNTEVRKGIPPEFVERVFTDIWSRCAYVQDTVSNRKSVARIIDDIRTFYDLIKK